jgi:hypothetical protein
MMQITIIPVDGMVYVDGVCYANLDMSLVPIEIHALQWKGDYGWIEFKDLDYGVKPQNQSIDALPEWAIACKLKWDEAKAMDEASRLNVVNAPFQSPNY